MGKWIVVGIIGSAAIAGVAWWIKKGKRWKQIGTLSEIYIYPIKSGHYMSLQEAHCTEMGLMESRPDDGRAPLRDRFFVIYDEKNKFVSAKNNPMLLHLKVQSRSKNRVVFTFPGKPDIEIVVPTGDSGKENIEMWAHEQIPTVDCGPKIAEWISSLLTGKDSGYKVGYWADKIKGRRNINIIRAAEREIYQWLCNDYTGAYSDLSSFMLMNQSSVEDMNTRISDGSVFTAKHFRPNLVVSGPPPYDEDTWGWIRIGDVVFRDFKPCTRCSFTSIDPETATRNPNYEPIKTLKKYRTLPTEEERKLDPTSPVLGRYIGLYKEGKIKVGDPVYIYTEP